MVAFHADHIGRTLQEIYHPAYLLLTFVTGAFEIMFDIAEKDYPARFVLTYYPVKGFPDRIGVEPGDVHPFLLQRPLVT